MAGRLGVRFDKYGFPVVGQTNSQIDAAIQASGGIPPSAGQVAAFNQSAANTDPISGLNYVTPSSPTPSDMVNRNTDVRTTTIPKTTNKLFLYGFLAAGALILFGAARRKS